MGVNWRKFFKWISYAVTSVLVLSLILITPVDTNDYQKTYFYQSTMARKDSLVNALQQQQQEQHEQGSLKAGWGVASITPVEPVRLTGKNFKPYARVFDSVYVRTLMFTNGVRKVVVLSYDLWIMHPHLAEYISGLVKEKFPSIDHLYFTANHSHTSIGGWASGLLGAFVVGGNHAETVAFIGAQTITAITEAQEMLDSVSLGFGSINTANLVSNRLDQNGLLDRKLRVLKIKNQRGQVGVFNTFSAHSVFMNKDINTLSADYPGPFLEFVQKSGQIDFASFAPGATGSHTPVGRKPFQHGKMLNYSRDLAGYFHQLQGQIETEGTYVLRYIEWPVDLRTPHFRITNHWRLRPGVFNAVLGKPDARITALRVGNVVLVGLPVELSGEFYPQFNGICQQRGLSLMITSFNGWYLGYVNPERYYYTLDRAETREMNWFGPQNGEYFVELVNHILEII